MAVIAPAATVEHTRAVMHEKVKRLVQMYRLFERKDRGYSVAELCGIYGVHWTTIYRDLIALQEIGCPLVVDNYRWRWMDC